MSGNVRGHNGWVVWRESDPNDGQLGYTRAEAVHTVYTDGAGTYILSGHNMHTVDATPEEVMLVIEMEEGRSKSTSEVVIEQTKEIERLQEEIRLLKEYAPDARMP